MGSASGDRSVERTTGGIRVLKSSEVDILADGRLDYPDELLQELDYTVCSIHSRFALGKTEQTERVLRAMDNRYFTILGHATGRLLLKRPGLRTRYRSAIIRHAQQRGCFFEINSSPDRLDLSADHARVAAEAGIKIAINTDAHGLRDFDLIRYGVDQARRAGPDKRSRAERTHAERTWPPACWSNLVMPLAKYKAKRDFRSNVRTFGQWTEATQRRLPMIFRLWCKNMRQATCITIFASN